MLKTYLYLPEKLKERINASALAQNKPKAEIIRQAIEKGLGDQYEDPGASARTLLQLAEVGKKYQLKGPKDSSSRIDELLWGFKERGKK